MVENPLQFALVREDPALEMALIESENLRRCLLIASGGCTALSLKARFPHLAITLLDPNPHQLEHVKTKVKLLEEGAPLEKFNVDSTSPQGVNNGGNFESLFRGLREFLWDLALCQEEMEGIFKASREESAHLRKKLMDSPYWPVAFDLFFSDSLLLTMFGPEAVQNAPPGSYPRYFQGVFEEGLHRHDYRDNYFLHHVLLGCYLPRPSAWPYYLQCYGEEKVENLDFDYFHGFVTDWEDLSEFDLLDLSNIFDWMSGEEQVQVAEKLSREMKPGSWLVIRQLNNERPLPSLFDSSFDFDLRRAEKWRHRERSLFYSKYNLAKKQ